MSHYSKANHFFLDLVLHNYASRHFVAIFTKKKFKKKTIKFSKNVKSPPIFLLIEHGPVELEMHGISR